MPALQIRVDEFIAVSDGLVGGAIERVWSMARKAVFYLERVIGSVFNRPVRRFSPRAPPNKGG